MRKHKTRSALLLVLAMSAAHAQLSGPSITDWVFGRQLLRLPVQAVNMETGKSVWMRRQRAPHVSGVLATAGSVVFAGDLDRYFAAFDQDDGAELWRNRLNDVAHSAPISYAVGGEQYVATTVGHGAGISVDRMPLVPEIRLPSNPGATLWAFELPDD